MYANAFLQTPASMLPEEEYKKQEFLLKRAKNLYLRGRDILLDALDKKYPGFRKNLDQRKFEQALQSMKTDDVRHLHIRVEDDGPGFDVSQVLPGSAEQELDRLHGRGIPLLKNLCVTLEYNETGNGVHAVFHLKK